MNLEYEQHLRRLEHRRLDVESGQREVGRACDELERRRKALSDEEAWTGLPERKNNDAA